MGSVACRWVPFLANSLGTSMLDDFANHEVGASMGRLGEVAQAATFPSAYPLRSGGIEHPGRLRGQGYSARALASFIDQSSCSRPAETNRSRQSSSASAIASRS